MSQMLKRFFIFLFIFGLVFSPNFAVSETANISSNKEEIEKLNEEIKAGKDKIKALEEAMAKTQKDIESKKLEAISLKNQLAIIGNRLVQIENDINLTNEKIKQAKLEIEALELNIEDKEKTIDKQKKIIAKIIKNVHVEDQKNYVEIMLTNDSFSDFYNQVKYLENVYTDLGRSVKTLRVAKEDLEDKKGKVVSKKQEFEDLNSKLADRRRDLGDQSNYKENLLTETHSSEQKYKTMLASLQRQAQAIENEVRSYEDQVRRKLESQDKIQEGDSVSLIWPTPSRYITATFRDPDYPYKKVFEHSAIDIRSAQGTALKAAASGYVARTKRCSLASCYSYVLIVHNGDISTLYGHLSSISVTEDQYVNRGDVIGYSGGAPGTVGAGPFTTGAHLHFEVRKNGIPVNPLNYLVQ